MMKVYVAVSNNDKFPRGVFSSSEAAERYFGHHRWEQADWRIYEFAVDENQHPAVEPSDDKLANSHDRLLAAAKTAFCMLDRKYEGTPPYEALIAAISDAEKLS